MELFNRLGIEVEYVLICLVGIVIVLFLFVVILFVSIRKQKRRLNEFMTGSDAKSLEGVIKDKVNDIEELKKNVQVINDKIQNINETLLLTYKKTGIVKYDAFKEMGGKLSFALAMLNDKNSGFIINSMHSNREGCFTYVKEVINGEAFVVLSEEEKKALEEAVKSTNYME